VSLGRKRRKKKIKISYRAWISPSVTTSASPCAIIGRHCRHRRKSTCHYRLCRRSLPRHTTRRSRTSYQHIRYRPASAEQCTQRRHATISEQYLSLSTSSAMSCSSPAVWNSCDLTSARSRRHACDSSKEIQGSGKQAWRTRGEARNEHVRP